MQSIEIEKYKNEMDVHRKALEIAEELGDKEEMGIAYRNLGKAYYCIGQYQKALDCHRKALKIAEELEDKGRMGKAYRNLGKAYYRIGQYQESLNCHRKSLEIAEKLGDKGRMGKAYKNMGKVYYCIGQYQESLDCHRKGLEIAEKLDDKGRMGKAYKNMGKINYCIGQYQESLDCYRKGLEIAEQLEDEGGMGKAYRNVGKAYYCIGQYQKALDCHRKAVKIAEELGDKAGLEKAHRNMGEAYYCIGQYQVALDCHRKALEIAEKLEGKERMGKAYYGIGKYQKSLDCYRKALEIAEKLGDNGRMRTAYRNMGKAYYCIGQYQEALGYYRKDLKIAKKLRDKGGMGIAYRNMGKAYYCIGQYQKALGCHRKSLGIAEKLGDKGGMGIAYRNSEIEASGAKTKSSKNDVESVNEQQPETNEEINNPAQEETRRTRRKKKSLISPELISSLMSIEHVQGFGVIDKELTIHVLEDHEKESEQSIKEALDKHPFAGGYRIKTFLKTDYTEIHYAVGGQSLYRKSKYRCNNCNADGTIGCLLQFKEIQGHDDDLYAGKIYAVTCHHVVRPDEHDDLISFQTTLDANLEELKDFSKEIGFEMLDKTVPVDIALLPVDKSCGAFNFEHDECKVYDGEICELKEKKVQKQGAITGLTEGNITSFDYNVKIEGKKYYHTILVESTKDEKPFSRPGDSGSLVTLSKNPGDETHEAVAMVFGGGELEGKKVSYTFDFPEAINQLLETKYEIYNDYVILSKFESEVLATSEDEEMKSEEQSPNTNERCEKISQVLQCY